VGLDEDAESLFDPRSELTPLAKAVRAGYMALEALPDLQSAYNAARAIKGMSVEELDGLALIATLNQKRMRGATEDEISAWCQRGPVEPGE
jgi:hypothetical protein